MKCDLKCPIPSDEKGTYCCKQCVNARKYYVEQHEEFKNKWNDKTGFLTENGCNLDREEMPQECINYNCKDYIFSVIRKWDGSYWKDEIVYASKIRRQIWQEQAQNL